MCQSEVEGDRVDIDVNTKSLEAISMMELEVEVGEGLPTVEVGICGWMDVGIGVEVGIGDWMANS